MNKLKFGTDNLKEQKTNDKLVRLQEQVKQQQAYLNHLKWKESASV